MVIAMTGRLYIVGTPIGNLGDLSPRAVEVLRSADFIAAEDTRVSVKLLNHFEIRTPLISTHEHNERSRSREIAARLLAGETCALITDAGMPAISDPGALVVRACVDAGIPVESVPGPSAITTALAISGLAGGRFCFEGFLSTNKTQRREHLAAIKTEPRTLVFFEAPHKLKATLSDLYETLGDREIALCRELTKRFEEVARLRLSEAAARYAEEKPRGEFVLVIAGALPEAPPVVPIEEALALAEALLTYGSSPAQAAKEAARRTGAPRNEIYRALVDDR